MADETDNFDWLEKFRTDLEEKDEQPEEDKRLNELKRMKIASAAFPGTADLSKIDEEKYLKMCDLFASEFKFTCTVPEGWEAEYIANMQAKLAKFGGGDPHSRIKPVGKKRLF